MTERDIQRILNHYTDARKTPFRMTNGFVYNWECDFWTLDSIGMTREYEIKISLADFREDAKKDKHRVLGKDGPNYFYYVCPEGLVQPDMIDNRYGLVWIKSQGIEYPEIVKKPRKLHTEPFSRWEMLATKYYWKWYKIWRAKYISKEITREEYYDAFDLSQDN